MGHRADERAAESVDLFEDFCPRGLMAKLRTFGREREVAARMGSSSRNARSVGTLLRATMYAVEL